MRKVLWAIGLVGALMIAAPFALGFPSKASDGQAMLDNFHPLMQQANVDKTAAYYNDVFVPLGDVVPAMSAQNVAKFNAYLDGIKGMQTDSENLIPGLAVALEMTPTEVQQFLATNYPAMSQMLAGLPQMATDFGTLLSIMSDNVAIFEQVPAGLEHYKPLVTTMEQNVGYYDSANSLPNFRLFTWFFVVPGVLILMLAGWGLFFAGQHRFAGMHIHHQTPMAGAAH